MHCIKKPSGTQTGHPFKPTGTLVILSVLSVAIERELWISTLGAYSQTFSPGKTIQQPVQNILSCRAMEFSGAVPSLKIIGVSYLTLKFFFFLFLIK